jgi:hypothetical protein
MTRKRRRWVLIGVTLLALELAGAGWGYRRLAWVAIDNLGDRELVETAPAVTIDRAQSSMSPAQEAYLLGRLHESPTPTTPRIHVEVAWNVLVCARVRAGHYVGPIGAEWTDAVFVNLFGVWVPVTLSRAMA